VWTPSPLSPNQAFVVGFQSLATSPSSLDRLASVYVMGVQGVCACKGIFKGGWG
jgi:hypothetical protein